MPSLENKVVTHMTLYADASTQNRPPYVYAKQYDANSRYLVLRIVDSNKDIAVMGAAQLNATKPDGTHAYIAGTANEDGTVTIGLTANLLAVEGKISCDITVFDSADGDQVLLTTSTFFILVDKSNYDSDAIESTDEFSTVSDVLTKIAADRAATESARDEAVSAAEEVQTTLATKADGLVLDGSRLYLTSGGQEIDGSSVEIVTDLTEVYKAIDEKADGIIIQESKLYLTSNGQVITEGVPITTDLSAVFEAIERKADGMAFVDGQLQLLSGTTFLGTAIALPIEIGDLVCDDEKLYLLAMNGERVGSGVALPQQIDGLTMEVEDDSTKLYLTKDGEPIGDGIVLPSGGGGSDYGSVIKVVNKLPSKSFTVLNTAENVFIDYLITSIDTADQTATGDCAIEWYVNGSRVGVQTVQQGENQFDVKPFLKEGTSNTVKLYAEDSYGNSRSVSWTINVTKYDLTWNLEPMTNHGATAVNVRMVATGTGAKRVHLVIDGTEVMNRSVTIDGGTLTYTISPQSHGAHNISAYLDVDVDGETVTTRELRHTGIWEVSGTYTPIVGVYENNISVNQFSTTSLMYMICTPGMATSVVQLKHDDTVVSELTVDRSLQTWAYKATKVGITELTIASGGVAENITLNVQSIGYDINAVTEGLILDINPDGHSNTETTRDTFGYVDENGVNHAFTFSENFDWINGGFQIDDDGIMAFVVKRGCYVMADRSLFNDDAKVDGKHIKMIFKSEMVRDPNTEIISCISDGVGLSLRAESATLSSELKSIVTPYCTDKKIEMDISIEPESDGSFACVYLKANPSRGMDYDAADRWKQSTSEMFKIGSEEADVWIYRIKMYAYALTRREILQNYIADCANPSEMVERYERNDVFNSDGSLDMNKLSKENPHLRVFHIKGNKMTTSKEDEVVVDVDMLYAYGGETHNFSSTGVIMKAQGTSSLEYIAAALNLDLDFSEATSWTNGKGEAMTSYAFSENAIPVDYFNLKADVASCEKANNVVNVERYNRFNPFVFKGRALDKRVRDTIEGHPCAVFFTNTSSETISVGDRTLDAGATMLYFAGNMNNSKKNFTVFGQDNTAYPDQCCVEIMNNNALECRFKKVIGDDETWKDGNFEFRYPKNPTDAMKECFKQVHAWVVSTDTTAATNVSLGRTIDYGEKDNLGRSITYTTDSAEYRKAKFIHEVGNYFHTNNLDFHYLYTEFTCGVDNRAKNCFMSYEPDANDVWRWSFRTHYDHDTSYGNDNSGGLTFTYGLEDIDTVGNANVFNASDSVLWCNVRNFREEELNAMYVNRESLGCWDAKNILDEFNAYQSIRPEALEMEDAHNKYRVPAATRYRSMMLGTKEYQRDFFIPKQEVYMASRHRGNLCTQHKISLRTNVPNGSTNKGDIIGVVPYVNMYLRCKFGNVGEHVIRAEAGKSYTMVCPDGANLNDLETYLFSSQNITYIGSLAHVYPKFVDFSDAPRIRKVEIGSGKIGYSNTSMNTANTGGISFTNNPYLEYIDLRNIPYLAQPLDLTKLHSLEEIYISGSGITGIEFAENAPVRIAALNSPKKLVARGLNSLESFAVGATEMTSIWVEESPLIDTLAIVQKASNLKRGRLPDVTWNDDNADAVTSLVNKAGFDEFGADIDNFVLKGSAHFDVVSQSELDSIDAAFMDLEVTYDSLIKSYTVTFQNYDGTVLYTQSVRQGGTAINPVAVGLISTPSKEPTVEITYIFQGWDTALTNVQSDLVITANYRETVRTYTIKWWRDASETVLLAEKTGIEVYSNIEYEGEPPALDDGGIWLGWDVSTLNVMADLNVHAILITPKLPDNYATEFEYLYSDNPNDNSGYTLAEFYSIIALGKEREYFSIGDKVKIVPQTSAFTDSELVMQIFDFNHFRLSNSTNFASVVFGMVGVMNSTYHMNNQRLPDRPTGWHPGSNIGGWSASNMRTYLNDTIYSGLPFHWKAMIKTVEVRSTAGNMSADIIISADKLFLFSATDIGHPTTSTTYPYTDEVDAEAENATFPIITGNASRVRKRYNGLGEALTWWTRSPDVTKKAGFIAVHTNGGNFVNNDAVSLNGVSFGFCI